MKLLVPHRGTCTGPDTRLISLAQFLGLTCEPVFLENQTNNFGEYLESACGVPGGCIVVNPAVIREWTGGELPGDLISSLTSGFQSLVVHAVTPDPFDAALLRAISGGRIESVEPVGDSSARYCITQNHRRACGAFSGISFGPVNAGNDCLLNLGEQGRPLDAVISISGHPFMAIMERPGGEAIFLASRDIADVKEEISQYPLHDYFSRFMPYVMALRAIFRDECWQPSGHYASLIIDDPLLRPRHGYLEFEKLLGMMEKHNFSTTIGFIPYNYRRSLEQTAEIFRQHSPKLSICFHGNDHTAGEFASKDVAWLNTTVGIAEQRMRLHTRTTGVPCSKVMVFPHENFSEEAMKVLKGRNFLCVVNAGASSAGRQVNLTLAEMAQPAVLRYDGMPLFLRKYIGRLTPEEVAFALYFGQPAFIYEHHNVFRRADELFETVAMINSMAPDVQWTDLETVAVNTSLRRKLADGTYAIRAYSAGAHIANSDGSAERFQLEWSYPDSSPGIEAVCCDGKLCHSFEVGDSTIRLSVEVPGGDSHLYSVVYRNEYPSLKDPGLTWRLKAFLRRRISEVRDRYTGKSRIAMKLFKTLQQSGIRKAF